MVQKINKKLVSNTLLKLFPDMHGLADANSHDTLYSTDAKYRAIIKGYFPEIETIQPKLINNEC